MYAYLRLLTYLRPYVRNLLMTGCCILGVAALTAALAYLVKPGLDKVFFEKNSRMLLVIPLTASLVYVLKGVCDFGQYYLMALTGQSIVRDLREQIFAKLGDLSLSFFSRHSKSEILSRVNNDASMLEGAVTRSVTGIIGDAFTVIGLVFVVFYQDSMLALLAVTIFPVVVCPLVIFSRKLKRYSMRVLVSLEDITGRLNETITGIRIVKAFAMEDYEKSLFKKVNDTLFRTFMRRFKARALSNPVMETLAGMCASAVVFYGGYRVVSGTSTPGTFFSFMAAMAMLYAPLKRINEATMTIQEGVAAGERIFALLDIEPEIRESSNAVDLEKVQEGIVYDQVGFAYEGVNVLKDVSLRAGAGEAVAIVGESGAGKSALLDLAPRFYDVTSGRILIDGFDIRDITVKSLREKIGMVTQETILFRDTVRNNIAYGRPDIPMERVIAASKAAHAHDFVSALPDGYDTLIGENGIRLSGGERQRLAIARALLKDPPILILDEATSNLDIDSEREVQDALEALMKDRTTLIVAHRLTTVRQADRIYVLVDGQVAEWGAHDELLALNGHFTRLYRNLDMSSASVQGI